MRRRTAWWRVAVVGAVLSAYGALHGVLPGAYASAAGMPGSAAFTASPSSSPSSSGSASSYSFAANAPSVVGAQGTGDAVDLEAGTTYRSSLPGDGKVYYRLELDASSTVYVSATAVPPAGTTVSATDGVRIFLQDADSRSCSVDSVSIGAGRSPRPITAWGVRELPSDRSSCQKAGTYYVVVERMRRPESSSGDWGLELAPVLEPRLKEAVSTSSPGAWDSATPEPPAGEATRRPGGAGFASAAALGQGVWRDDVRPGQTLFYEVPVGWGQQLYATAEVGSSGGGASDGDASGTSGSSGTGGAGFVASAVNVSLYNPVREFVDDTNLSYSGSQKSGTLAVLPPVEYANRYAVPDRVNGMRFAGAYYLVVHLAERVGEEFGDGALDLTLHVRVAGEATGGPGYAGQAKPAGIFGADGAGAGLGPGGGVASGGGGAGGAGGGGGDAGMRLVAAGGIGVGTLVLVVLGVWTVVGRRRAAGV
ncbi:hypothetical protein ABZ896_08775 [Streptomyces sp. NPDC047072]|uniref:hypothetical protein n=1 Tax=Streptomyces sp. NPDC047072 TaxID=3154809 RepID=UPI0033F5E2B5